MKTSDYILKSLINAVGTAVYVFLVSSLLSNAETIFGVKEDTLVVPVFMLLLLIVSATVTGLMVLGKPLMLYHGGQKKEGITLLLATVGWLVVMLLVVGVVIIRQ